MQETKKSKRKPEELTPEQVAKRDKAKAEAMDAMLDEIDEVLEENAAEFVRSYVQKGGQ